MLSIAARQWLAEGRAEGMAEGKAKGKVKGMAEGKAKGMAQALARVLVRRFGDLPERYQKLIDEAELPTLDAWLDRAIDAPSIEAVFSAPTH